MNRFRAILQIASNLGVGWLVFRGIYAVRRRLGSLARSSPCTPWERIPEANLKLISRKIRNPLGAGWNNDLERRANSILAGEYPTFSSRSIRAGTLPNWHRNHQTGQEIPSDIHWSRIGDFEYGDIKHVWELSRFAWAFDLGRAFAAFSKDQYADGFWRLFRDWCDKNPPNCGANWMCGQEASLRLMAVLFAAEIVGVPKEHRPHLARFVWATGQRIEANIGYAVSQKNNHGISESVGLVTAGLALSGTRCGARFVNTGMRILRSALSELVYSDGGFSQHSLIYHRVLLAQLTWCRNRLELYNLEVPDWLTGAATRALDFLVCLTDPQTGLAPLYGTNDGANILPLAECSFLDMRPIIQACSALFRQEMHFAEGPWDEAAFWIMPQGRELPRSPAKTPPPVWHAPNGGLAQLTSNTGRLLLRCPTRFLHRPGQADMLHVSISYEGRPIALDGGSYSYNSTDRFTSLSSAAQHNAVTFDEIEPLEKFQRFLYLPWPRGTVRIQPDGSILASHDGYARLGIQWARSVAALSGGGFLVVDTIRGCRGRKVRWHWRLVDAKWEPLPDGLGLVVNSPELRYCVRWSALEGLESRLLRGDEKTSFGWVSNFYGTVEPACSLILDICPNAEIEMRTTFSSLT